ncbi:hypothetical protein RCN80_05645 [Escherichia coli]|nr:hypothetical protein [Escherichia coli]MED0149438.1 hypothetical protein [Escherichia coli]MED9525192.1 hypothetical protein [Escherichia coli]MED9577453.1 hypothetical protein [Escherichia coli]HAY0106625.1 hypothetical protein [Escherichia coli]
MKVFNKLILCAVVATAFGANAATYNRTGETTKTIVIANPLTLQAANTYKVIDGAARGGALVRTTDNSPVNLYIAVGDNSESVDSLKIKADSGNLTLIAQGGCGGSSRPVLDLNASLPGSNSAAIQCLAAPSISTIVQSMQPENPEPGEYTFTQEYGTFVE